jgi:DNA modification methylase
MIKWVKTISEGTTRTGGSMGKNGWKEDSRRVRTTGPMKIPDSVWRVGRCPDVTIEHPAIYPVGLPSYALLSWPGNVYDPFLGSGTTLIAAHRLGRRCFGMEIEPRYCDVILKRAEAEGLTVDKIP